MGATSAGTRPMTSSRNSTATSKRMGNRKSIVAAARHGTQRHLAGDRSWRTLRFHTPNSPHGFLARRRLLRRRARQHDGHGRGRLTVVMAPCAGHSRKVRRSVTIVFPKCIVIVGNNPTVIQRRRVLGPLDHRPHEARHDPHRHRPAASRGLGRSLNTDLADPSRHRWGARPGLDQRHRPGRPVRPRLRCQLVLRLRAAGRACGRVSRCARGRDHGRVRGPRSWPRAPVRHGQAGCHTVGAEARPAEARLRGHPRDHLPERHHGQHRQSRRQHHREHRLHPGICAQGHADGPRQLRQALWQGEVPAQGKGHRHHAFLSPTSSWRHWRPASRTRSA